LFVGELGDDVAHDQVYRLTYDGSVADVPGFGVMGGQSDKVEAYLGRHYQAGLDLASAIKLAVTSLGQDADPARTVEPSALEIATLSRSRPQPRKFKRLSSQDVLANLSL
jgi:proteasome alpha subunit